MRLSIPRSRPVAFTIFVTAALVAFSVLYNSSREGSSSPLVQPVAEVSQGAENSPRDQRTVAAIETTPSPRATGSTEVLLSIGGNDDLRIRWIKKPTPSQAIEGDLATEYERLREEAKEDYEAAYQLWKILDSCKFAYESGGDLDVALSTLTETQSVRLPGMDEPRFVGDESSRNWREALEMSFDTCSGITDEMKAEKTAWLKQASDAGYPLAMMHYSRVERDPQAAMDLAIRRWQAGDVDAMRTMYQLYQQDYESGAKPENKVPAYAHLLVYKLISERKWGPRSRRLERFLPEFESARSLMRPHELAEAEAIASRLIASNRNCCFRH